MAMRSGCLEGPTRFQTANLSARCRRDWVLSRLRVSIGIFGFFMSADPESLRDATVAVSTVPLSVTMPVYNEQEAVFLAVTDVQRNILDLIPGAELVVVDDGSKDQSGRLLDEAAAMDVRVRVIHQQNRGHGGALMTALSAARGEYVLLIDSDRQISLESFPAAWAEIEKGFDGVFGVRRLRHDPLIRLYLTKVVRTA